MVEVCEQLAADPGDAFLQAYAGACAGSGGQVPRLPDVADFLQIASACLPGMLCPSFESEVLAVLPSGYYSNFGFDLDECEPGYICNNGQRVACPIGFTCPSAGMTLPQVCAADPTLATNCAVQGLAAPQPCANGTLCIAPYIPPIPAPPGYAQSWSNGSRGIVACPDGDWCGLGRAVSEGAAALACPAGTYCSNPAVLEPVVCNLGGACNASSCPLMPYCAAGSTQEELCPPGWYCASPTTASPCSPGTFCPEGSALWSLCGPGEFCANASVAAQCPENYYCPQGSVEPVQCNSMSHCFCDGGCSEPPFNFVAAALAIVLFILALTFLAWHLWGSKMWKARAAKAAAAARDNRRKKAADARSNTTRASRASPVGLSLLSINASDSHGPGAGGAGAAAPLLSGERGDGAPGSDIDERSGSGDAAADREGAAMDVAVAGGSDLNASERPSAPLSFVPARSRASLRLSTTAMAGGRPLSAGTAHAASLAPHLAPTDSPSSAARSAQRSAQRGGPGAAPAGLAPKSYTLNIRFEELGLRLKKGGHVVLSGVTGQLTHGRVTAVMGPSGAGKTTFLTSLAGKATYGTLTGSVFINGQRALLTDRKYKHLLGFVPQEDVMHRDLTVRENVVMSALTRLPATWSHDAKLDFAESVLEVLGLVEIADSIVGDELVRGISGGQRKRVNIALELAADPLVLFLDEPTSGLDSTGSLQVCSALTRIARLGITVALVLHQPRYEIFAAFDDLLILGKGGRTVYLGPVAEALPYFEAQLGLPCPRFVNPADHMLDVVGGTVPPEWARAHPDWKPAQLFDTWDAHRRRGAGGHDSTLAEAAGAAAQKGGAPDPPPHHPVNVIALFYLYLRRALSQQLRHPITILMNNALLCVSALVLALVYYGDVAYGSPQPLEAFAQCPSLIADSCQLCLLESQDQLTTHGIMTLISVSLAGVATFLPVLGNEKVVYFREASALPQPLQSIAYFLGKDISMVPQLVAGPALFCAAYEALTTPRASFAHYYLVFLAVYFAASGVAHVTAVLAPASLGQLMGVSVVFSFAMFSGASPSLPVMASKFIPLRYAPYISFIRWALEAMYTMEVVKYEQVVALQGLDLATIVSDTFAYEMNSFGRNLAIVFAFGVGFRLLAMVAMMLKDGDKKK